jgi:putative transposase
VKNYNTKSKPFTWVATADSILQKVKRICKTIHGTRH